MYNGKWRGAGSVDNLLRVYNLATPTQWDAGVNWYQNAHAWAKEVARKVDLSLDTVVAVCAAISPRNRWEQNKKDTLRVIEAWQDNPQVDPVDIPAATFNRCVGTAINILTYGPRKLYGPKVRQFYRDILRPEGVDQDLVTVDTWAFRAWVFDSRFKVPSISLAILHHVSQDYLELAEEVNLPPRKAQAVVWEVVRYAGRGRKCRLQQMEQQLTLPLEV